MIKEEKYFEIIKKNGIEVETYKDYVIFVKEKRQVMVPRDMLNNMDYQEFINSVVGNLIPDPKKGKQ